MKQSTQAASATRKSGYNPHKYRRQVRQCQPAADGVKPFTVKSMTRNDGTRHNCGVDERTGAVFCDCENFYYRHQKHLPTLHTPAHWCKHILQAVEGMARRKEVTLVHTEEGALAGAVVRYDEPQAVATLDAEHDDYLAQLEQAEAHEADEGTYSGEVEDDDPFWLERAAYKYTYWA